MKIGEGVFQLRVAETENERTEGLGGVAVLPLNEGMFFIFPADGFHAMWMKNMLIPIDIIWLTSDFLVIDARDNVLPSSFPEIFSPQAPARFVVELPADALKAFSIKEGSRTEILSE